MSDGNVYVYTTSLNGDRLSQSVKVFDAKLSKFAVIFFFHLLYLDRNIPVVINTTRKYQEILGFGGAITDAVIDIRNQLLEVSKDLAELLHKQYYGPKGN